jgi:methionine-rich copper-binding protein CopC
MLRRDIHEHAHPPNLIGLLRPRRKRPNNGRTADKSLTFTDTLEAAFSSADVTDSSGARVDEGKPQVNGNMIRVRVMSALPPKADIG